jgi:hypothetical protein
LFLSPKEAAAVDTAAIYEAAANGLQTLIQYDERLEDFLDGVLHPSSVDLQRELKTADVKIFCTIKKTIINRNKKINI